MNFELIGTSSVIDPDNEYEKHNFYVYRETSTDVLYVSRGNDGALTVMLNPETGLPLTYEVFQEKYKK